MDIVIYADGACSGKSHIGGYAFIILSGEKEIIRVRGGVRDTTNNAMELTAIIKGIKHAISLFSKIIETITVYSDSAYCVNSIEQGWIYFWKENYWLTKSGDPVKNMDLWQELIRLQRSNKKIKIKIEKVKAHAGNKYNEIADHNAKQAILDLNAKSITK